LFLSAKYDLEESRVTLAAVLLLCDLSVWLHHWEPELLPTTVC